jgi:putative peptide zinc metalloprotease protein
MLILNAPHVFATAWDSLSKQTSGAMTAAAHGNYLLTFLDGLQALLLVLPALGLAYSGVTTVKRVGALVIDKTEGRPALRAGAFAAGAAVAVLLVWSWLPHGRNYTPIQRTDTGTVAQGATTVLAAPAHLGAVPAPVPSAAPAGSGQPATHAQPSAAPSSAPANPISNPTPAATLAPTPGASPR